MIELYVAGVVLIVVGALIWGIVRMSRRSGETELKIEQVEHESKIRKNMAEIDSIPDISDPDKFL